MKHAPRLPRTMRKVRRSRHRGPREIEDEVDWSEHELIEASPAPSDRNDDG